MAPRNEVPRYKVLERCYHNEEVHDPERQTVDPATGEPFPLFIDYEGVPGPHLEPANDAARAMCEKHADRMHAYDVVEALTPGIASKAA